MTSIRCKSPLLLATLVALACTASRVGADAPPSRYTSSADTVLDNKTGLTWQRALDAGSYTQAEAASYCAELALAGDGWRLPTRAELLSITDPTLRIPAIDPTAFPDTPNAFFWSSSAYVPIAGNGWVVNFSNGGSRNSPSGTSYRVRCVR